jgi:MFS family permease
MLPPRLAYALVAGVIGRALFASGTPSPLYGTYRELWGFSPVVLTLVYATYAFGVLVALVLAGRVCDEIGRRPSHARADSRATVPGGGRRMLSGDGYELRFALNYLAGYLLTRELVDQLCASAPARIVAVPVSSLQEGVLATLRLIAHPALEGITGKYLNGTREPR